MTLISCLVLCSFAQVLWNTQGIGRTFQLVWSLWTLIIYHPHVNPHGVDLPLFYVIDIRCFMLILYFYMYTSINVDYKPCTLLLEFSLLHLFSSKCISR